MDLHPITMTGDLVRLEPLVPDHLGGLIEATADGGLDRVWYTRVPGPEAMADAIRERLRRQADGESITFTAFRVDDGSTLGMTSFYDITPEVPRVSIGYTWNRRSAQGSGTNAESKLLLLTHAFETWGCGCVRFKTSWHNAQSRAAIERLGARRDGVLRADSRHSDGSLRDTVVYSILAHEWAAVRSGLQHRLRER